MTDDERYCIMFDEIVELKKSIANIQSILKNEGFDDIESMIAKYKNVLFDSNEIAIQKDEQIESLTEQLKECRAERDKAVSENNVIYCRDCTHYRAQRIINGEPMYYVCCHTNGYSPDGNHFCAWGEQSPIPMRYRYTDGCTYLYDRED